MSPWWPRQCCLHTPLPSQVRQLLEDPTQEKGRVFTYLLLDRDPEDENALKVGTLSTGREREVLKQK